MKPPPPPKDAPRVPKPGEILRDSAIDRTEAAHRDWVHAAVNVARAEALMNAHITTDDLWYILNEMGLSCEEPRAMGAVIRKLLREKIIESSGQYVNSARPECHARPIMLWRSLLY